VSEPKVGDCDGRERDADALRPLGDLGHVVLFEPLPRYDGPPACVGWHRLDGGCPPSTRCELDGGMAPTACAPDAGGDAAP
jgi:hypothetical protein